MGLGGSSGGSPQGRTSWLYQHYIGKKQKRIVFGHFPPMAIKEARGKARDLRGNDEHVKVFGRRKQLRDGLKLSEAIAEYLALNYKPDPDKPTSYGMQLKGILEGVADKLGKDRPIASVSADDRRDQIRAKRKAGHDGAARYLFAVLRPFFKWCVEEGQIHKSPLADLSAPAPLQARDRLLSDAEVRACWQAVDCEPREEPRWFNVRL